MAEEHFVMVEQESEKIVHDDANDVQIEDCQTPALEEHLDAKMSTEVPEHKGLETRAVWSGQEWNKYV